jgi:hypothetical protein
MGCCYCVVQELEQREWLFIDGYEYTLGEICGFGVKDVQGDLQMGPKMTNATTHLPFF